MPTTTPATLLQRSANWQRLTKLLQPIPKAWVQGRSKGTIRKGGVGLEHLPCDDWKTLINTWRRCLEWTDGLDNAFACMLASILSTPTIGNQLWVRVVGNPSCGKSTLCEALSVNRRFVLAKSTLRGFHSGYDDGSGQNHSPLKDMNGKALVIKDGDALITAPNLSQILSEARDIYDGVSRSSYRTKQSKDWEGLRLVIILCGTESLRFLDSSELGERFLVVRISDGIDEDLEDRVAIRVAYQADRDAAILADGTPESQENPEYVKAKQMTAGYIDHLRDHAEKLLKAVSSPDTALRRCTALGKFVAFCRSRPSSKQDEVAQREMSFRLVAQLVRLAKCLAVVLGKTELDSDVMARVSRVALDTAQGRTMEIMKHLYEAGSEGLYTAELSSRTLHTEDKERVLLKFLKRIGAVEEFQPPDTSRRKKYRLLPRMQRLYGEVTGNAAAPVG